MCPEQETLAQGCRNRGPFIAQVPVTQSDHMTGNWLQVDGSNLVTISVTGSRVQLGKALGLRSREQVGVKVNKSLFKICYYYT